MRPTMQVYDQVQEDVDCMSGDCPNVATHWVTDGKRAYAVCEDCRDELTSEPQNYRELRVV